ncbi:MAG: hypothetical protein AB7T14_06270 [Candidatus Methylacidiphilaceae bacterium]
MNMRRHPWKGFVLAAALGGIFRLSTAWAGGEFEPTFPKFPYGPTDAHGNPYSVSATDLVYSPQAPYVRSSSEAAKLHKTKRATRRPAKRKAAALDSKGTPLGDY